MKSIVYSGGKNVDTYIEFGWIFVINRMISDLNYYRHFVIVFKAVECNCFPKALTLIWKKQLSFCVELKILYIV